MNFQAAVLSAGGIRVQLATSFLNSAEFRQGTGPRLTVFLVYALLLQRDPFDSELALRIAEISGRAPVKSVVQQIISSPEFGDVF